MLSGLQGSSLYGGGPRLSGMFSGLDTSALIEAALQAKRIPAVRLENRVSMNEVKITAFTELNSAAEALRLALDKLRNPPGSSGVLNNIFEGKAAYLTSSSTTPGTSILGITAKNSATAGSYEMEVLQLAQAHKIGGTAVLDSASNPITDGAADLGITDTMTVGLSGGATADIAITADMGLDEIAAAINAKRDATGVRASVVKVSDTDFRLVMTAEESNKAITVSAGAGTMTQLGGLATELQAAQPARVKIDDLIIERDSNTISDALTDVTLDLYKAEVGTTVTVEIESDLAGISEALVGFVDAYNGLRDLIASQQAVDGEAADENAVLFGDNTLRSLSMRIGNDIASSVGVTAGQLDTLRGVGIKLDANNRLTIDQSVFDANLVDKLDEVRGVFEFGFTADNPNLRMITRSQAVDVGNFTVEIAGTDASGYATGVNVPGYGAVFDIEGSTLIGKEGTAFEGMTLAYVGPANAGAQTVNVQSSLGIAERLYQTLDLYTKPGDGEISQRLAALESQNKDMLAEVAKIDERLATYQQYLVDKYSAMEQAIARAEAMTKQLEAMLNNGDD